MNELHSGIPENHCNSHAQVEKWQEMRIVEFVEKDAYIACNCAGRFNVDEFIGILAQAIEFSISKGKSSLLVNVADVESGPLDAFQRYSLGEKIAQTQLQQRETVRIAVVGGKPLIEERKFAETVALNRGAIGKGFHDLQEAIEWIG